MQSHELLKKQLTSAPLNNDLWGVWIDWYRNISQGRAAFDHVGAAKLQALERRIALGDGKKDFWDRAPNVVNNEIEGWVRDAREPDVDERGTLPSEFKLRPPQSAATQFSISPNGQISLQSDSLRPAVGRVREDMQVLYEEARDSAVELHGLGTNKLGKCALPAESLVGFMPQSFADASINRLWSRANQLRDLAEQHRTENLKPVYDRDAGLILEGDAFVKLETCVKQLNVLIAFDERGRELDRLSYGPGVRERDEEQIAAATPIIQNIFHVADNATVNLVQVDHNAVTQAGRNIHGDQALERVVGQELNLVAKILLAGRRIAV